jgi:hypothetical protein
MAFLIGILDKSALFSKDQMDCHTITTVVACNLMVLLFRRNLPMPDTPLKNNSDQQTERHFQALMLVIQDWAAADTAWVNAGTFFSAGPDACNTGTVLMFANVGSVRILMVITLPLRRMAPRMVDEVETTMEATIISNHRRSMSIIFPTILDQDLAMAAVGILIQMDADNTVINLLVAILLVMIPTMDMGGMAAEMEDQTDLMDRVDQTGQVDLAGLVIQMDQADQGGQGGQIATELAPGADANVDADLVFLMTAFLAIVGIMEHPLPRAAVLWHSKVTLPTR